MRAKLWTGQAHAAHVGGSAIRRIAKAAPLGVRARKVSKAAADGCWLRLALAYAINIHASRVCFAFVSVGNAVTATNRGEDFDACLWCWTAHAGHVGSSTIRYVAKAAPFAIATRQVCKSTADVGEAALVGVDAIGRGAAVAELIGPSAPAAIWLRGLYTEASAYGWTNHSWRAGGEADIRCIAALALVAAAVGKAVLVAVAVRVWVGAEVIANSIVVPIEHFAEVDVVVGLAGLGAGVTLANACITRIGSAGGGTEKGNQKKG